MLLEQLLPGSPAPIPIRDLPGLARSFAGSVTTEACRLSAPPGDRRWRRLAATPQYDAWLIAWGAGSGLELHDHGGSSGAFSVISGGLIERGRDLDAAGPFVTRRLRARDSIVVPPTRVHAVTNPYAAPALSVHVYSPPLRNSAPESLG